jgi:hypothetical protein
MWFNSYRRQKLERGGEGREMTMPGALKAQAVTNFTFFG